MKEKVDVCIIGGGVVGLFCAFEQAKLGRSVRIIDKLFAGSNRFHIGDILLQGFNDEILSLAAFSRESWADAAQNCDQDLGYTRCGGLRLALSKVDLEQLAAEVAQEQHFKFDSELITDLAAIQELMAINTLPQGILGIKYSKNDASIDPHKALEGLKQLVVKRGVRIWGSDEVVAFEQDENGISAVITDNGDTCAADHIIIAAGAWSAGLFKLLDIALPVRPARVHVLEMLPTGKMPTQTIDHEEAYGRIVIKYLSTGRAIVTYSAEVDQAQATWSTEPDPEAVAWITRRAGEMLPSLHHAEHLATHTVSIDITPDGLPYVGHIPGHKRLWAAFGMNGKCYAFAAGVARHLARLSSGEASTLPPETENAMQPSADRFMNLSGN